MRNHHLFLNPYSLKYIWWVSVILLIVFCQVNLNRDTSVFCVKYIFTYHLHFILWFLLQMIDICWNIVLIYECKMKNNRSTLLGIRTSLYFFWKICLKVSCDLKDWKITLVKFLVSLFLFSLCCSFLWSYVENSRFHSLFLCTIVTYN